MPAPAESLTQTKLVPLQTTGFTDSSSLTFDKFNVADHRLDSVEFQFSGHIEGGVQLENQSTSARTIETFIGATLTLKRPDNTVLLDLSPTDRRSDSLGAFDGTLDFAGSSGVTHNNLADNQSGETTLIRGIDDLSPFTGSGSFTLLLSSLSTSGDTAGGSVTEIFNALASAQVNVVYTYSRLIPPPPLSLVPEPSSFALLGIGGGFSLLFGHWKRRSRRKAA